MSNILSIKNEFKKEIESVWNNPKFSEIEVIKRGFGVHDEIIKNSLLFIGINPSYKEGAINEKNESYFINLNQEGKNEINGKQYPYFKKFVDITNRINKKQEENSSKIINWSHMDLLFHRETKQHFIENLKKEKNGIEFINEQLKIAEKILINSKPKIIIVSNTKARNFLKGKEDKISIGFDFKFNNELGTYTITNNQNLNGTPVFFTSMLTGQRALDNGSYERLVWHINYVLNKINNEKN